MADGTISTWIDEEREIPKEAWDRLAEFHSLNARAKEHLARQIECDFVKVEAATASSMFMIHNVPHFDDLELSKPRNRAERRRMAKTGKR